MPRKEACESFYVCRDANCIFLFAARDLVKREKGDQKNVFRKKKKTHFVKQYVQLYVFLLKKLALKISN